MIKGRMFTTSAVETTRDAAQAAEQERIDQEWSDMMASLQENGLDPDSANRFASLTKENAETKARFQAPVVVLVMTPEEFEKVRKYLNL